MSSDIPARLAAATGPDRELDALVLCHLLAPPGSKVEQSQINDAWCIYEPRTYGPKPFALWGNTPGMFRQDWFRPTASIDAAVALVERMRGDRPAEWSHSIMQTAVEMAWRRFVDDGGTWAAWLPIALLKALFAALAKPGPGAVG